MTWFHGGQALCSSSAQASCQPVESHRVNCWHLSLPPSAVHSLKIGSDYNVPQDMLTGKIWLSSQLNWECTRHSLLDKLWLAAVHQASELWKPLMDEIWTSIFLSSCLLNKLLLKFTAMFADMCFRERSRWRKSRVSYDENMRTFFWWASGLMRSLSYCVHRGMKAAQSQVNDLKIGLIVNQ